MTACYLINRSPTLMSDKTPNEIVTGEKPDISFYAYALQFVQLLYDNTKNCSHFYFAGFRVWRTEWAENTS